MTDEKLKEAIRTLTALKKVTLGDIERVLKMPQNCLSGMMSGSRNIPSKWKPLLVAYVEAKMEGATEIVISIGDVKDIPAMAETTPQKVEPKAEKPTASDKSMPGGMSKSQQLRWHRENNQTLQ